MVLAAARYLIVHGPATPQERWEENSGYSPSTLASNIAALICAAHFAASAAIDATARLPRRLRRFPRIARRGLDRHHAGHPGARNSRGTYIRILPADVNRSRARRGPRISATMLDLATGRPARSGNFRPARSSTPASWNWCATASARRRSADRGFAARHRRGAESRLSRRVRAGGATITTATASAMTAARSTDGAAGGPGRC